MLQSNIQSALHNSGLSTNNDTFAPGQSRFSKLANSTLSQYNAAAAAAG